MVYYKDGKQETKCAMTEKVVNITVPVKADILLSLKETKDEFVADLLYSTALTLFRKGKLSLGKAAELAGYDRIGFIEKLQKEKEFIFDYTEEEINEIFEDSEKLP